MWIRLIAALWAALLLPAAAHADIKETIAKGEQAAVVESLKAASELYAPVSGKVVEINQSLEDDPSQVNADPTGKGWFVRIRISAPGDLEGLMDEAAYTAFTAGQG